MRILGGPFHPPYPCHCTGTSCVALLSCFSLKGFLVLRLTAVQGNLACIQTCSEVNGPSSTNPDCEIAGCVVALQCGGTSRVLTKTSE